MTNDMALNIGNLENKTGARQEFLLSRNPDKAMQEMMESIDALHNIYVEENEALETANTQKFMVLQQSKIKAARRYQLGTAQILERKDEFRNIDRKLREELRARQEEFSGIADANLKAINRMNNGVKRLGDRIMRAARETARKDGVSYSAAGYLKENERAVSTGLSESA